MSFPRGRLPASQVADQVSSEDYGRLLGYPADHALEGVVLDLAATSREWYARRGQPWAFAREVAIVGFDGDAVELAGGAVLSSEVLCRRLRQAEAESLTVAAVSSGPEIDERATALWQEDRPDEAFFLDRFGAAVAEYLAAACGDALRPTDGTARLAALPGYSPGYDGWELAQQVSVYELLTASRAPSLPGPLAALESGMLAPKNSLLTVLGMTPRHDLARRAWSKTRCGWCSMPNCGFRHLRPTQSSASPAPSIVDS